MAWRICPSGVHSANSTSTTSLGSTQCSLAGLRFDQRPGLAAPAASGERSTSSRDKVDLSDAATRAFQPVPTLPTDTHWPPSPDFKAFSFFSLLFFLSPFFSLPESSGFSSIALHSLSFSLRLSLRFSPSCSILATGPARTVSSRLPICIEPSLRSV